MQTYEVNGLQIFVLSLLGSAVAIASYKATYNYGMRRLREKEMEEFLAN